jgi:hypothetical protein
MENLLPDRRAWTPLDAGDNLPVDTEEKKAEEYRKQEIPDHVNTL